MDGLRGKAVAALHKISFATSGLQYSPGIIHELCGNIVALGSFGLE